MSGVQAGDFEQFFFEMHGREAFPWQKRLARQVCEAGWPKVIDLPTASGKTACIDIAVFALAVRGKEAARRILFVVDRRVIVSEAYERAGRIARSLDRGTGEKVGLVAAALRELAGADTPLDTYELRGGAFRDERWIRSPLQPTVIASTVDQVGSRLLFRGYGVSENTWAMHAGLLANDALIFLDEAHCSKAFAQTLQAVERYRGQAWVKEPLGRPFQFVEMTATPAREVVVGERFGISEEDRGHEVLRRRIFARKPTRLLEPVSCKKDDLGKFAGVLIREANTLADEAGGQRVAIMVNRVNTAKAVYEELEKGKREALLVIGRMRALDRDWLAEQWKPLKAGAERRPEDGRVFVVATQCLEVGADLDFDVLVSECAGMDALQQRFGRLDRLGEFGRARGAVAVGAWQLSGKEGDPVYGEALRKTWEKLGSFAVDGQVEMGIASVAGGQTVAERVRELSAEERSALILQGEDAPMLLPAHVDALVQTSPRPEPEPFVDFFLHGRRRGAPDVYVVWRSDLEDLPVESWNEVVALCPPSSSEAMPVPLWVFRKWFAGEGTKDESDVEVTARVDEEEGEGAGRAEALIWRGADEAFGARRAGDFLPGDTVVLRSSGAAWEVFGFKPKECRADRGDEARLRLRRRICLRLQPDVLDEWPVCADREKVKALIRGDETEEEDLREALRGYALEMRPRGLEAAWQVLSERGIFSRYPAGEGWIAEGYYEQKKKQGGAQVLLEEHLQDVERAAQEVTGDLLADGFKEVVTRAARYHDYGKADERYQTWLRNGDALAARYAPKPIAKSSKTNLRRQTECGLPGNFRHEMLSLLFAAKTEAGEDEGRELLLHLVASHHGRCRPFAPVELDEEAGCVTFGGLSICRKERMEGAAHALGSGVAERFWSLTRRYGWWGLAYLETMLRLADWQASDGEQAEVSE